MSIFNANSVDPDQMPYSVASDLGLHCLSMSLLQDTRPRGYKTSFMLNSAEHGIYFAYKS